MAVRPWTRAEIKDLIARTLAKPCPRCGAATETQRSFDVDIVCSKGCGWILPIDTGPFSLGRRVD